VKGWRRVMRVTVYIYICIYICRFSIYIYVDSLNVYTCRFLERVDKIKWDVWMTGST